MNYELKTFSSIKKVINEDKAKKIVIWGLSEKTRDTILNKLFKVNYIVDNDKNIQNTKYNGIPIKSLDFILNDDNFILIVWGNHCSDIYTQLSQYEFMSKVIFLEEDFSPLFKISSKNFKNIITLEEKKDLFKEMVTLIEIEPHSYCNRTCWFCPNSFIDRKTNINFMDLEILTQLLKDLASINYSNKISFTRYSEPFANNIFYDRLKLVNNYLPNSILHANTNSDYINNQTLEKAYSNGLKSLNIQIYLKENEEFSFTVVSKKANKIIKRISDVDIELYFIKSDWIEYKCIYKDMNIKMYARDFKINGTNRSELDITKKNDSRTSPCSVVFSDIYIDYNANIVPCCNIRSDNPSHSSYVLGTLENKESSIFDIYFSKTSLLWRESLFSFDKKKSPCSNCTFSLIDDNDINRQRINEVKKIT